MRKSIIIISLILLVGAFLIGCSDDPRVAPTQIFIVNTEDMQGKVKYDPEIGYRIVRMKPKETLQLEAVTNRWNQEDITWESVAPSTATVDQNGLVTAMNTEGQTLITVTAKGVKKYGVCIVFVSLNDGPSPTGDGMSVRVNTNGLGGVLTADGGTLYAPNIEYLKAHPITLTWEPKDPSTVLDHIEWYKEGALITSTTVPTLIYTFTTFGNYNLSCVAFSRDRFGNIHNLGSTGISIKTRPELL